MRLAKRILSALIDLMFSGFIMIPFMLVLMFFDINYNIFVQVLLFSFSYTVFICKDLLFSGRSLGKYIMKLDILDKYGNTPTIITLILRNTFTFIWPLELLMCIINPEKKIEDFLLGTRVVSAKSKRETYRKKNNVVFSFIATLLVYLTLFYVLFSLFYQNNELIRLLYSN